MSRRTAAAGWPANPQAMAAATKRAPYDGDPLLSQVGFDGDTWLTPRFILSQLGAPLTWIRVLLLLIRTGFVIGATRSRMMVCGLNGRAACS
jgi:hypothetical protein